MTTETVFSAMFQDFSIYEASVAENVAMSRQPDKKRVRDALEKVELLQELPDLDQKIGQEFGEKGKLLSGGQLQRLVLARTIYADREILVMDEPISAIDVLFEKRFYELVHKYLKDKTIIFVSHRPDFRRSLQSDLLYGRRKKLSRMENITN